jgi:CBS domain-containing protein
MNVGQLMSRQIRTCRAEDSLNDAARIMWEEDCGCVPVVQADDREHPRLVGIVTDRDVCMAAYTQGKTLEAIPVTSVMQRDLATCVATDPVGVALSILRTRQLHRLPVVAGDSELVGLLSLADLARESKREVSQLDHPVLTAVAIGDTVAVISETRDAGRAIVATE